MIVQRLYSKTKKVLGYGAGYLVGSTAGEVLGEKAGKKIKRDLNENDLKEESRLSKSHHGFISDHKKNIISRKSIKKYEDNDEIIDLLNKYGVRDDQPDDYDFRLLNKNKSKVLKGSKEKENYHNEVIANPKDHPGNHSKRGRLAGSIIGTASGLAIAHKILKRK